MPIWTTPGYPGANSVANGGKIYAFNNLTTAPQVVAAANTQRTQIVFHNPGDVDVFVAPSIQLVGGTNATLTPSTAALGGCFRVFSNGGSLTIMGECQGAWQAFSASGNSKPLTVMDSNI